MSHQPDLLPTNISPPVAENRLLSEPDAKPRIPVWLERAELFLRVVIRIYVGVLLFLLPWTRLWESNHFFREFALLATFTTYGAVKGIVSGLGLLNLWIAISDAIRYRER